MILNLTAVSYLYDKASQNPLVLSTKFLLLIQNREGPAELLLRKFIHRSSSLSHSTRPASTTSKPWPVMRSFSLVDNSIGVVIDCCLSKQFLECTVWNSPLHFTNNKATNMTFFAAVIKTHSSSNHPLAHFETAICSKSWALFCTFNDLVCHTNRL